MATKGILKQLMNVLSYKQKSCSIDLQLKTNWQPIMDKQQLALAAGIIRQCCRMGRKMRNHDSKMARFQDGAKWREMTQGPMWLLQKLCDSKLYFLYIAKVCMVDIYIKFY